MLKLLQDVDPELEVVMSADGEGNTYSPFADLSLGRYEAESTWSGEFRSADDDSDGETVTVNAVALWPTN